MHIFQCHSCCKMGEMVDFNSINGNFYCSDCSSICLCCDRAFTYPLGYDFCYYCLEGEFMEDWKI